MTPSAKALLWLPVGLYAFLIFMLSARPADTLPYIPPGEDKVLHFFEYVPFGFLAIRAVSKTTHLSVPRSLLIAFFVVFLYSLSDEIHQLFVPGRSCDALDLISDAAGALIGFSGYLWRR